MKIFVPVLKSKMEVKHFLLQLQKNPYFRVSYFSQQLYCCQQSVSTSVYAIKQVQCTCNLDDWITFIFRIPSIIFVYLFVRRIGKKPSFLINIWYLSLSWLEIEHLAPLFDMWHSCGQTQTTRLQNIIPVSGTAQVILCFPGSHLVLFFVFLFSLAICIELLIFWERGWSIGSDREFNMPT